MNLPLQQAAKIKIIQDLEKIFKKAMLVDNFTAAIKAKETQLKEINNVHNASNSKSEINIEALSDTQLSHLLQQIQKYLC